MTGVPACKPDGSASSVSALITEARQGSRQKSNSPGRVTRTNTERNRDSARRKAVNHVQGQTSLPAAAHTPEHSPSVDSAGLLACLRPVTIAFPGQGPVALDGYVRLTAAGAAPECSKPLGCRGHRSSRFAPGHGCRREYTDRTAGRIRQGRRRAQVGGLVRFSGAFCRQKLRFPPRYNAVAKSLRPASHAPASYGQPARSGRFSLRYRSPDDDPANAGNPVWYTSGMNR